MPAEQLLELLPVPTGLDDELRRLPLEELQDGIGIPAEDPRSFYGEWTRGPLGEKCRKHRVEFERENVFRAGIRSGAGAHRVPQRSGCGVARGGKEKRVARGIQILLEKVEPERPGLWVDEKTARTKTEKPLIFDQEHG